MADNTQHKLDTIRPPRVQITYDVMVGNATEQKELPFVVAIMADLSGMRVEDPLPLKDRSFVGIYEENINDIMAYIKPQLKLTVNNRLLNNKGKFKVDLKFETMDDFHPVNLIKQIPILQTLYESRVNLQDLLSKMDGNDELEEMLMDLMQDPQKQEQLLKEIDAEMMTPAVTEQDHDAIQTLEELPPVSVEKAPTDNEFISPYEDEIVEAAEPTEPPPPAPPENNDEFF